MTVRGQQLAVMTTCLVAALSYAGAVTTWALCWFVLPGAAGAVLVGSVLVARRMAPAALIVGGLLVLGWSELANVLTGSTNGPAARSTFVAAGCSLLAGVMPQSRRPALFVAAVAGVVAGALILGAGGEVPVVAIGAAICATFTLGCVESSRRNWTTRPRRSLALIVVPLLVGVVATGTVVVLKQSDPMQPRVFGPGRAYPGIKPGWRDPLAITVPAHPQRKTRAATNTRPRSGSRPPATAAEPQNASARQHGSHSRVRRYGLAALALLALAAALLAAGRLLIARRAWRRLRVGLATGTPADRITGAWAWTRLRLEACHLPLAVAVSPDTLAAGGAMDDVPTDIATPLRALGRAATAAAFSHERPLRPAEAAAAWRAARRAEVSARDLLTRRGRFALAFRRPTRTL